MTLWQEVFIDTLNDKDYSYEISGDKIVVTYEGHVYLSSITHLPPGVEFNNKGMVILDSLTSLRPGTKFNNFAYVDLESLTSLPPDVEFNNGGYVDLESLTNLPPGVVFKNGGEVYLRSLIGIGFKDWKGNIKGVDSKRLLNVMIKQGMFI
jgi:hypothetical protein